MYTLRNALVLALSSVCCQDGSTPLAVAEKLTLMLNIEAEERVTVSMISQPHTQAEMKPAPVAVNSAEVVEKGEEKVWDRATQMNTAVNVIESARRDSTSEEATRSESSIVNVTGKKRGHDSEGTTTTQTKVESVVGDELDTDDADQAMHCERPSSNEVHEKVDTSHSLAVLVVALGNVKFGSDEQSQLILSTAIQCMRIRLTNYCMINEELSYASAISDSCELISDLHLRKQRQQPKKSRRIEESFTPTTRASNDTLLVCCIATVAQLQIQAAEIQYRTSQPDARDMAKYTDFRPFYLQRQFYATNVRVAGLEGFVHVKAGELKTAVDAATTIAAAGVPDFFAAAGQMRRAARAMIQIVDAVCWVIENDDCSLVRIRAAESLYDAFFALPPRSGLQALTMTSGYDPLPTAFCYGEWDSCGRTLQPREPTTTVFSSKPSNRVGEQQPSVTRCARVLCHAPASMFTSLQPSKNQEQQQQKKNHSDCDFHVGSDYDYHDFGRALLRLWNCTRLSWQQSEAVGATLMEILLVLFFPDEKCSPTTETLGEEAPVVEMLASEATNKAEPVCLKSLPPSVALYIQQQMHKEN
jgi:hypothetical protein